MSKFFINRPIVAMVILDSDGDCGCCHHPRLCPWHSFLISFRQRSGLQATYVGADAKTLEQSVATPIEQTDQWRGQHGLHVFLKCHGQFADDPERRFRSQDRPEYGPDSAPVAPANWLPLSFRPKSTTMGSPSKSQPAAPLMLIALSSPQGTHDEKFLSNYANIKPQ